MRDQDCTTQTIQHEQHCSVIGMWLVLMYACTHACAQVKTRSELQIQELRERMEHDRKRQAALLRQAKVLSTPQKRLRLNARARAITKCKVMGCMHAGTQVCSHMCGTRKLGH